MHFLEIRSKVKNHHISETGVSFEIQFGLWIKIWAGEHIFYIWQQTIALKHVTPTIRYAPVICSPGPYGAGEKRGF